MEKVSVIIPIYNVEKYLKQCLDSVVKQTLKEIEIICVNDGSTDGSLKIIEEYARCDERIKIINKENTGYGHSMNAGLSAANGEYIGIVESDDFAEPDMFERLYKEAIEHDADVVKSNYFMYQEQSKEKNHIANVLDNLEYEKIFSPADNLKIFSTTPCIWSGIYRRDFLKENHIIFNETPGASFQDTSFAFKVWACAARVFFIKEAFLHYRTDNLNSSVKSLAKVFCVCDEYEEIENFLRKNNLLNMKFNYIVEVLKYRTYQWNYHRLSDQYKYQFLVRAAKEFCESKEKGLLYKEYWSNDEWIDVHSLMENTKQFFHKKMLLQQKNRMYLQAFLAEIQNFKQIVLYGAGIIGKSVAESLKKKRLKISYFAVSSIEGNPQSIFEIPVGCVKDLPLDKENSVILISTKQQDQIEIFDSLTKLGFTKIILMDTQLLKILGE